MRRAQRIEPAALATAIRDRLPGHGGLILVLDYDGTLIPIAPTSTAARLTPEGAETLTRLTASGHAIVAVVSGRTLADLAGVLPPIAGLYRFGTHGAEGVEPGGAVVHAVRSGAPPPGLRVLAEKAGKEAWPPGVFIENKGPVITLHYRLADDDGAARACERFLDLVRVTLAGSEANVLHGRRVIEVRAPGVNKGAAVRWLRRRAGVHDPLVVCIGDDATDEDAFDAVGEEGVSVLVALRDRPTRAGWRVGDPEDVMRLLDELGRDSGILDPGGRQ
jgi:trehalose 6-phosphate phosphatase